MSQSRQQRIKKLAAKLSARHVKRGRDVVMSRKAVSKKPRLHELIGYDLETSNIAQGTPTPKYLTVFGESFFCSIVIKDIEHLGVIIRERFLVDEFKGARFVAWNGNRFDVYFIAAALLHSNEFILKPYLTNTNNLRGLRVIEKRKVKPREWEFLDGMAMTGIQKPLRDFLKVFAPEYQKMDGPDFEHEAFDARNEQHRRYAERDSEGLYHAMMAAQAIVMDNFGLPLMPTIGNLGIKIFMSNVPEGVFIRTSPAIGEIVRQHVMRGGYCHAMRKFEGPVWKYDINQAYAAAMRDAMLPAGNACKISRFPGVLVPGIYKVIATSKPGNIIPFYFRNELGAACFDSERVEGWLCDMEVRQLMKEGWSIKVEAGYWWDNHFNMKHYVDKLEQLRIHGPGGPKSAQGEMLKAIGNNSYGKTVEKLTGLDLVMALEQPENYSNYQHPDERLQHLWFKIEEPRVRDFHQPAIGAFITAHVRMVVRRAALQAPESFLYADTDCVVFDKPVDLPIDPGRYGFWKQETDGEVYRIITKKVYANLDASEKHAKGMNIKRLTAQDFENWFNGQPPEQKQLHRQNFLKAMTGEEMFIERTRIGQKK